jgi:thioredoxin 1
MQLMISVETNRKRPMNHITHVGWLLTTLLAWTFVSPVGGHCLRRTGNVRRSTIRSVYLQRAVPRPQLPREKVVEAPPAVAEPVVVSDADFEQKVLRSSIPVLVDFWAVWCPPCRAIAPTIDDLAKEYQGRIMFAKLDIDANPQSPEKYEIQAIPTLLFFRDGLVVERVIGLKSKEELTRVLDSLLGS